MKKAVLHLRFRITKRMSTRRKRRSKDRLYASYKPDAPPALRATPLRAGKAGFASGINDGRGNFSKADV